MSMVNFFFKCSEVPTIYWLKVFKSVFNNIKNSLVRFSRKKLLTVLIEDNVYKLIQICNDKVYTSLSYYRSTLHFHRKKATASAVYHVIR